MVHSLDRLGRTVRDTCQPGYGRLRTARRAEVRAAQSGPPRRQARASSRCWSTSLCGGAVAAADGKVRRVSIHRVQPPVRPESGLTDDDFSPVWADDDRPRIPRTADGQQTLTTYLDYYRATVELKCRDLTSEQARDRSMPPSTLSLHGVVRHLAGVERWWFQQNFERPDVPFLVFTAVNPNLDFEPPADADFAADLDAWRAECAVSRQIVAAHALDDTARPLDWNEDVDLRWLVLRMITEYGQHCGHLDLLREGIDGRIGA